MRPCLLLLVTTASFNVSQAFGLSKCCPQHQLLDLHTKDCIDHKDDTGGDISIKVTKFDKSRRQLVVTELPYSVPTESYHQCERRMKRNIKDFVLVSTDGTNETLITDDGDQVDTEFCVDNVYDMFGQIGADKVVAQVCDICNVSCISFCCPQGFYSFEGLCQEGNVSLPQLWPDLPYTRVVTQLVCNYTTYTEEEYSINNGLMEVDGIVQDHSQYCIDHRLLNLEDNVTSASVMICSQPDIHQQVIDIKLLVTITLWILSDVSVLIIFIWHLCLLKKRTKRFFVLKTIFLFCVFTTFLLLISFHSVNFDSLYSNTLYSLLSCYTVAFLIQYFSTASFFWLCVISIDLFQCFKVIKSPGQTEIKVKICSYFCMTFICPALISLILVILQQIRDEEKVFFHPRVDNLPCSMSHYHIQFLFINIISGILLFCVLMTLFQLRFFYSHSIYSANPQSLDRHKTDYSDILDLFLVTLLGWICDLLSFILGWVAPGEDSLVWALDSVSAGAGILMLLATISRRNNRKLIREHCGGNSKKLDEIEKQVCKVGKYQQMNVSAIAHQEQKITPTVGQYQQMTIFDVF